VLYKKVRAAAGVDIAPNSIRIGAHNKAACIVVVDKGSENELWIYDPNAERSNSNAGRPAAGSGPALGPGSQG